MADVDFSLNEGLSQVSLERCSATDLRRLYFEKAGDNDDDGRDTALLRIRDSNSIVAETFSLNGANPGDDVAYGVVVERSQVELRNMRRQWFRKATVLEGEGADVRYGMRFSGDQRPFLVERREALA